MPTLEKVSIDLKGQDFCLTDCGPSDGCSPDDLYETNIDVIQTR